jgi:hypothetical protein
MVSKIISLSVWGNDLRYLIGADRQYKLAKQYYPDWEFRIYTDDKNKFSHLADANIIEVTDGSYGMFWRFRAMFESEDNIVIVRDSDSRITVREQKAVNEWLDSKYAFHTFRDHEAHFEFPIIGCAFGYKGIFGKTIEDSMHSYADRLNHYVGDQIYLRDIIWPLIKNDVMIHSMNEGWFEETRKQLVNPYDFCGNGYTENDMPLYPPTLAECARFNPSEVSNEFKFNNGSLKS